jgi:serine/threonine-protein phosphatase 5
VRDGGFEWEHGPDKLVTVFSAPNYCDQMGNKGAYIHFKRADGLIPHFHQFTAVPHPPVRPMQYANMLANM